MFDSMLSSEFSIDPYPIYRQMRQGGPLVWDQETHSFYVVTYAESVELLSSGLLRSRGVPAAVENVPKEDLSVILPTEQFFAEWMVFSESSHHRILRDALRPVLSPRSATSIIQRMHESTWATVATASGNPLESIAIPIAQRTLQEILGVTEAESRFLTSLSAELIAYLTTPGFDVAAARRGLVAVSTLERFVGERIGERQGIIMPVLADLATSGRIPMRTIVAAVAQFLTGVVEPTATLIASMLNSINLFPALVDQLSAGNISLDSVVEEALRHDPPFHYAPRTAAHPFRRYDVDVAAGSRVVVILAAANRDDSVWESADQFNPMRPPHRHLAFGLGGHSCLGAAVARHQARAVLEATVRLEIFPRLEPLRRARCVGGTRFEYTPQ